MDSDGNGGLPLAAPSARSSRSSAVVVHMPPVPAIAASGAPARAPSARRAIAEQAVTVDGKQQRKSTLAIVALEIPDTRLPPDGEDDCRTDPTVAAASYVAAAVAQALQLAATPEASSQAMAAAVPHLHIANGLNGDQEHTLSRPSTAAGRPSSRGDTRRTSRSGRRTGREGGTLPVPVAASGSKALDALGVTGSACVDVHGLWAPASEEAVARLPVAHAATEPAAWPYGYARGADRASSKPASQSGAARPASRSAGAAPGSGGGLVVLPAARAQPPVAAADSHSIEEFIQRWLGNNGRTGKQARGGRAVSQSGRRPGGARAGMEARSPGDEEVIMGIGGGFTVHTGYMRRAAHKPTTPLLYSSAQTGGRLVQASEFIAPGLAPTYPVQPERDRTTGLPLVLRDARRPKWRKRADGHTSPAVAAVTPVRAPVIVPSPAVADQQSEWSPGPVGRSVGGKRTPLLAAQLAHHRQRGLAQASVSSASLFGSPPGPGTTTYVALSGGVVANVRSPSGSFMQL